MKLTFLIIFLISCFIATAQVKKDSVSGYIYPLSKSAKDLKTPDLSLQNYLIDPFNGKKKILDSNYIDIHHVQVSTSNQFPPAVFIDSVKVNYLGCIDPKDIADVTISNGIDSLNNTRGKIYITTFKKQSYHFITIEALTKRCIPNFDSKTQSVIYVLNDKLVTDTANMMFETTYIRNVEVVDGSQIKAFKGLLSNVIVLNIYTGDAPIYLR